MYFLFALFFALFCLSFRRSFVVVGSFVSINQRIKGCCKSHAAAPSRRRWSRRGVRSVALYHPTAQKGEWCLWQGKSKVRKSTVDRGARRERESGVVFSPHIHDRDSRHFFEMRKCAGKKLETKGGTLSQVKMRPQYEVRTFSEEE